MPTAGETTPSAAPEGDGPGAGDQAAREAAFALDRRPAAGPGRGAAPLEVGPSSDSPEAPVQRLRRTVSWADTLPDKTLFAVREFQPR